MPAAAEVAGISRLEWPIAMSDSQEPVKFVDRRRWARDGSEPAPAPADEPVLEFDKPSYVQELEQQLAAKNDQLQEYVNAVHEMQREFEAMRARVRKEAGRDAETHRRAVFADLLDVVDNLDRAVAAAQAGGSAETLVQGVQLVRDQFLHKLSQYGISRIEPIGEPFDPEVHEAVTTVPITEAFGEGIVAGIAAPGYLIGGEVLRPAAVAVASAS
jgi:molecular chaperone GrpE